MLLRFSRDDRRARSGNEETERDERDEQDVESEGAGDSGDPIHSMTRSLQAAIEGVREDARDQAIEAVNRFAREVEAQRSRRAPIPPRDQSNQGRSGDERSRDDQGGDVVQTREFRAVGDARDVLYRRMERGRSPIEIMEFRRARNPRMDELAKLWAQAIEDEHVGERVRLYEAMNDQWLRANGLTRASLLEGLPTGENPLSAGSGAKLLPLPLVNQLILERDKRSKFRGIVNVFPMTAQTQRIPVLPTVTASARLENSAYTDNTPTADTAMLTAKDVGVMFSAGRNFLEDTAFNIVNQLTVVAGGAIGAKEDAMIATATGNAGEFKEGLSAATITDVPETTTNTLGFVDIVALYYAVPEQYRSNAAFFATSSVLSTMTRILDLNGRPILLNGMDAPRALNDIDPKAAGFVLGHPIYDVPTPAASLFFGDPMWYALGDRAGIRVDTDRVVSTGNRQWVIDERADGRVIPTSAVGTNNAWRKILF